MNPEQLKKALDAIEAGDSAAALEILKAMIASAAASGASAEPAPETAAAGEVAETPPPDPEQAASIAASRELMRITATKTPGEAVEALGRMHASVQELVADRAALDLSARQGLVTELVTAGVETPATAWADVEKRTPKKRFMDEPLAELRERVKIITATARPTGHRPPAASDDGRVIKTSKGDVQLSAREIKNCETQGADVNAYAENKAIRASARNRN